MLLPKFSIRFAPPLVITEADLMQAVDIIKSSLEDLDKVRAFQANEETTVLIAKPLCVMDHLSSRTYPVKSRAKRVTRTRSRIKSNETHTCDPCMNICSLPLHHILNHDHCSTSVSL